MFTTSGAEELQPILDLPTALGVPLLQRGCRSPPLAMDVEEFTSKERKQARKSLLKKIDTYNKQVKKKRQPAGSFPITSPSKVSV